MPDQNQPASTKVLRTEFKLAFDPANPSSADSASEAAKIKQIFAEPAARALWLFLRRDHLASQWFNQSIWIVYRHWQKLQPLTVEEFEACFCGVEDPAVSNPWRGDTEVHLGDDKTIRTMNSADVRRAKLGFLLDAMYGRIPLTITMGKKAT